MIKDGNIKQSIFKKTFNLTGKTLQEKYIEDSSSKEKIHFSFPDLFSDFTSNESVDNKFDINNQDIVPAYYATNIVLKDYINTHLPYKIGIN